MKTTKKTSTNVEHPILNVLSVLLIATLVTTIPLNALGMTGETSPNSRFALSSGDTQPDLKPPESLWFLNTYK